MKKVYKQIFSVALCLIMILGTVAVCGGGITDALKASADTYSVGDTIEMGSYPQSKVEDTDLISELNGLVSEEDWVSYNYYSGTGSDRDGNMKSSDYMTYVDKEFEGEKYRAVKFESYRPMYAGYESTESNSYQDDNGYYINNIYWFKYQPLSWIVINPDTGLVLSTNIIDSQAFHNYLYYTGMAGGVFTGGSAAAATYSASDIHSWLNNDFMNTAFNDSEKTRIEKTKVENNSGETTYDHVFLLSSDEVLNSAYDYSLDIEMSNGWCILYGTDYAKCQGLTPSNTEWRLRTDCNTLSGSIQNKTAFNSGNINKSAYTYDTSKGIRPAMIIDLTPFEISFNSNGGQGNMTPIKYTNSGLVLPDNAFAKSGSKFISWNTAADGSGISYAAGTKVYFDKATELYAIWEAENPKLRINTETNSWEVSYDDGTTWTSLNISASGEDGVGISSVDKTSSINNIDIYTITLTNGKQYTFTVTNGIDGKDGAQGETGADGKDGTNGKDGASIVSATYNSNGELILIMSDGSTINAGKPNSAYDSNIVKPNVTINAYQSSRSVDYGTTITFHSTVDSVPEGYAVHWFVNGEDKGSAESLTVSNAKDDYTVCARLMKNGSTISESKVEKVTVKNDIFSQILAFFKKLFNSGAFVIDQK